MTLLQGSCVALSTVEVPLRCLGQGLPADGGVAQSHPGLDRVRMQLEQPTIEALGGLDLTCIESRPGQGQDGMFELFRTRPLHAASESTAQAVATVVTVADQRRPGKVGAIPTKNL